MSSKAVCIQLVKNTSLSFSLFEVFHLEAMVPDSKYGSPGLNVMPWLTVGSIRKHYTMRGGQFIWIALALDLLYISVLQVSIGSNVC